MICKMFLNLRKILDRVLGPRSKVIRSWRMIDLGDDGMYCFFDPKVEKIYVCDLTSSEKHLMIKTYGSVSGAGGGGGVMPHQVNLFRKEIPYGRS